MSDDDITTGREVVSRLGDGPDPSGAPEWPGEGGGRRGESRRRGGRGGGEASRARGARRPWESSEPVELENPEAVAREVALRQLSMAPRSRAQLAAAMGRKGVPEEVADAVLDRFEEIALVDDEAFAEQWVRSRHEHRGLAGRALAHELRRRGVADETVKEAVAELTPEQELETARALVRRKLRLTTNDDPTKRLRRLVGMLARKGYGSDVAMAAVRAELADAEALLDPDLD